MKYNAKAPLVLFDGTPMTVKPGEPMNLGTAIQMTCMSADPAEFKSADAKYQLYKFASRAADALKSESGTMEFTMEELVVIKKAAATVFLVGGVGCLFEALDRPIVDHKDASVA